MECHSAVTLLLSLMCHPSFAQGISVGGKFLSCPDDIHVSTERGYPWARVWWNEPIFTSRDGQKRNSIKSHATGQRFYLGNTTVSYTSSSPPQGGRMADVSCTFRVSVVDTEPPIAQHCPTNVSNTTTSGQSYATGVHWVTPVFEDNVAIQYVASTYDEGDRFPIGDTEVTYSAEDSAGNIGRCTFNVTVLDVEEPVFDNCPRDIIAMATRPGTRSTVHWQEPVPHDNSGYVRMTSQFSPGHRFEFGRTIVSYVVHDGSNNRAICTFSVLIKASVPENRIYIRSVLTNSMKLAWPETTDTRASSYLIYTWNAKDVEPKPYEHIYQTTDRTRAVATRMIEGLEAGQVYNIRIVVTGSSSSIYTQQRTLPHPPTGLLCEESAIGPTSFKLKWTPSAGSFHGYHVTIRETQGSGVVLDRVLDKSETVTVTGLEPDTKYACVIQAISGGIRDGVRSDAVSLNVRTKMLPPLTLQAMKITATSLEIIFSFPAENSDVLEYRQPHEPSQAVLLYMGNEEVYADTTFPLADGVSRFRFAALEPLENYTVKAIDNESGRTIRATFFTEPPEVVGLRTVYVRDTSFFITWHKIDIPGLVYEIDLSPRPAHMDERITTYINECHFDHLVTMETYVVTVSTMYGNYRSVPRSIRLVPGVDHDEDHDQDTNSDSFIDEDLCLASLVTCAALLLLSLVLTIYISLLSCRALPPCLIPFALRTGPSDENSYEVPGSIVETKDSLPTFDETDLDTSGTSRGTPLIGIRPMGGNLYNRTGRENIDIHRKYHPHQPKTRTQSERTHMRLKRSSSLSALYLNVSRRSLLLDEDTDFSSEFYMGRDSGVRLGYT